jgi:protein-disulfide isomerase
MMYARPPRRLLLLALLACSLTLACGKASDSSPAAPTAAPTAAPSNVSLPALDVMLADKVLGNASAPVTMIEYSSLTCSHCADFHASTLPRLTSTHIDTGRVRLIFREFPLDTTALSASMVARCSGDRFFAVLDRLFQTQSSWGTGSNTTAALKTAVAPTGMTAAEVDACLAMTDLKNGILAMKTAGQSQFGVGGTPTFILSGHAASPSQTIVGAWPFATFDAAINSLLTGS